MRNMRKEGDKFFFLVEELHLLVSYRATDLLSCLYLNQINVFSLLFVLLGAYKFSGLSPQTARDGWG